MIGFLWRRPVRFSRRRIHTLSAPALPRKRTAASILFQWRMPVTIFYSTVIGAAAAADVHVKQQRREDLGNAIARVKDEIDAIRSASNDIPLEEQAEERRTEPDRDQAEVPEVQALPTKSRFDEIIQNLGDLDDGPILSDDQVFSRTWHPYAPQSIYATAEWKARFWKEWTPKKVMTVETSVAIMVARLQELVQLEMPDSERERKSLDKTIKYLSSRLQTIKARRPHDSYDESLPPLQHPRYTFDELAGPQASSSLNERILGSFRELSEGLLDWRQTIAYICHHLMTSHLPPDLETYSILINKWTQRGDLGCANIAVQSLFQGHIRFNESTAGAILDLYRLSNQPNTFHRFVQRLTLQENSPMLAGPWVLPKREAGRIKIGLNGQIHQGIYIDADLASRIMRGYLHFDQPDRAADVYHWIKNQHQGYSLDLFAEILRYCWHKKNWASGEKIWQKIKELWIDPEVWSGGSRPCAMGSAEHHAFHCMLQLCRVMARASDAAAVTRLALARGLSIGQVVRDPGQVGLTDDNAEKRATAIRVMEHKANLHDLALARVRKMQIVKDAARLSAESADVRQLDATKTEEEFEPEHDMKYPTFDHPQLMDLATEPQQKKDTGHRERSSVGSTTLWQGTYALRDFGDESGGGSLEWQYAT